MIPNNQEGGGTWDLTVQAAAYCYRRVSVQHIRRGLPYPACNTIDTVEEALG